MAATHCALAANRIVNRLLANNLQTAGLVALSQDVFPGEKNQIITKLSNANGMPSVQLEINFTWLLPENSFDDIKSHRFSELVQALVNSINDIADIPTR
jgi:hypothetical protein